MILEFHEYIHTQIVLSSEYKFLDQLKETRKLN